MAPNWHLHLKTTIKNRINVFDANTKKAIQVSQWWCLGTIIISRRKMIAYRKLIPRAPAGWLLHIMNLMQWRCEIPGHLEVFLQLVAGWKTSSFIGQHNQALYWIWLEPLERYWLKRAYPAVNKNCRRRFQRPRLVLLSTSNEPGQADSITDWVLAYQSPIPFWEAMRQGLHYRSKWDDIGYEWDDSINHQSKSDYQLTCGEWSNE